MKNLILVFICIFSLFLPTTTNAQAKIYVIHFNPWYVNSYFEKQSTNDTELSAIYEKFKADISKNNISKNLKTCNLLIESSSDNLIKSDFYRIKGDLYYKYQSNNYTKMIDAYYNAVLLNAENNEAWSKLSELFYYSKDTPILKFYSTKISDICVTSPSKNAYWCSYQLNNNLGNYEAALHDLNQSIKLSSYRNPNLIENRAELYTKMKKYDEAIDDYTKLIQDNWSDNILTARGKLYLQTQQYYLALEDFLQQMQISKADSYYYTNVAEAYYYLKNYAACIDYASQIININPYHCEGFYWKSMAYFKLNNYQQALDNINQAIKIQLNDVEFHKQHNLPLDRIYPLDWEERYYYQRALIYMELQNNKEAKSDLQKVVSCNGVLYKKALIKLNKISI